MELIHKEDIFFINRKTIQVHGGSFVPPFNMLKEGALEYITELMAMRKK